MFFSAHGVPVTYVEDAGDPYKAEMEECVDLIMAELKRRGYQNPHTLAYQVWFDSKTPCPPACCGQTDQLVCC